MLIGTWPAGRQATRTIDAALLRAQLPAMSDPAIRAEIAASRAAGFPDLGKAVELLHRLIGDKPDPDMDLIDSAYAWHIGVLEITIARAYRGEAVDGDMLEIAIWADGWWPQFEATFCPTSHRSLHRAMTWLQPSGVRAMVAIGGMGAALSDSESFVKVAEKWGFGMAPPKSGMQQDRTLACERLLNAVRAVEMPDGAGAFIEAASAVKGLVNRVAREDQWDWFTVSRQLGYPSRRISFVIAREIAAFRNAVKEQEPGPVWAARSNLHRLPFRRCLSVFLGKTQIADEPGAGSRMDICPVHPRVPRPAEGRDDHPHGGAAGERDKRHNRGRRAVRRPSVLARLGPARRGEDGPFPVGGLSPPKRPGILPRRFPGCGEDAGRGHRRQWDGDQDARRAGGAG